MDQSTHRNVPHNEGRDALLRETLTQMRTRGPALVQPKDVCDALGLSKSLVNFHFGGRDGLIAEAMVVGYEEYVDFVRSRVESAGDDPEARLFSWIDAQIDWTVANPGLAAGLNFMRESSGLRSPMPEPLVERFSAAGLRNFQTVWSAVRRARVARHPEEAGTDPLPAGLDAAVIAWTTLGASVWFAGQHLPTSSIGGPFVDEMRARFRRLVLAMLDDAADA